MAAVSGVFTLSSNATLSKALGNFGTPNITATFAGLNINWTVGSGANQYNNCYVGTRTVVSGTPDTLNLTSGALLDPTSAATNFADLVLVLIYNRSSSASNLSVGGGSNDVTSIWGPSGVEAIPPGGAAIAVNPAASGYAVTASTANILQLVAASGTNTYDIMLLGH